MPKNLRETFEAYSGLQSALEQMIQGGFPEVNQKVRDVPVECAFGNGERCSPACDHFATILAMKLAFSLMMQEMRLGGDYDPEMIGQSITLLKEEFIKNGTLAQETCKTHGRTQSQQPSRTMYGKRRRHR